MIEKSRRSVIISKFQLTNSHRTLSSWSLSITNSLQFTKPSGLSQKPFNRWSKIPTQPNIKILKQFHFSSWCHNIIFVGKEFGCFVYFFFQNNVLGVLASSSQSAVFCCCFFNHSADIFSNCFCIMFWLTCE